MWKIQGSGGRNTELPRRAHVFLYSSCPCRTQVHDLRSWLWHQHFYLWVFDLQFRIWAKNKKFKHEIHCINFLEAIQCCEDKVSKNSSFMWKKDSVSTLLDQKTLWYFQHHDRMRIRAKCPHDNWLFVAIKAKTCSQHMRNQLNKKYKHCTHLEEERWQQSRN